jgi:Flp pilus assembly protein TadD
MAVCVRLLGIVGLAALLLVGAGCQPEAAETAPQSGVDRSPAMLKALQRTQMRAQRRPRDLQAQLTAGKLTYEYGLYNDAYQAYLRAVNIDPRNFDAMVGMARTNLKLQNPTQGLDWVGRVRRVKPNDRELLELEARLYLLAGKMDPAIAAFRRATELEPDEVTTWLNLASAYAVTRQYDRAVAAAQRAVSLAPNSAAAHFVLGRFSDKNGDRVTAEREYRSALRLDAKHTASMLALARSLVARNSSLDEARKLAVQASQVEAERADAAVLAAWILHLQGADDKAADELVKVVNAMPQHPEGWQKLAIVMRKLGQIEQAERAEAMAKQFLASSRTPEMELLEGRR